MRAGLSGVVFGLLLSVASVVASAADHTIRSVPYESVPVAPAMPVKPVAPRVEAAPMSSVGASVCRCKSGLVCVGSRGGRYCVTPSGNKKYM